MIDPIHTGGAKIPETPHEAAELAAEIHMQCLHRKLAGAGFMSLPDPDMKRGWIQEHADGNPRRHSPARRSQVDPGACGRKIYRDGKIKILSIDCARPYNVKGVTAMGQVVYVRPDQVMPGPEYFEKKEEIKVEKKNSFEEVAAAFAALAQAAMLEDDHPEVTKVIQMATAYVKETYAGGWEA